LVLDVIWSQLELSQALALIPRSLPILLEPRSCGRSGHGSGFKPVFLSQVLRYLDAKAEA